METKLEHLLGQFQDRRVEFLREYDIPELMDLFPDKDKIKELLIETIIEYGWDKKLNEEVK